MGMENRLNIIVFKKFVLIRHVFVKKFQKKSTTEIVRIKMGSK